MCGKRRGGEGRGGKGLLDFVAGVQTTCRGSQKGNPIGDSGAKALAMVSGTR